ncbi:hypothetical protein, unlikely [Trypanosoma brucei gambiense DAL972]|uniref:Uncharacterized protein n=1 Tax=Trypanosoma brucei gambiense (strain MHOM/CI/86/DAL972) TaxID=679716 RepID=D0A4R3_TRYB9|nr:hypothetical protein, unlikely [Trypanosoma brucei gambiense DAL972]CBH16257.1 hypothetical protein, unlikely [Trypanosoma brucei gambiense DAL972]|eukprot:XP_011778521.1 hypothetical protein, unlikely [Trypanosoma brucei gambiense DAL972]
MPFFLRFSFPDGATRSHEREIIFVHFNGCQRCQSQTTTKFDWIHYNGTSCQFSSSVVFNPTMHRPAYVSTERYDLTWVRLPHGLVCSPSLRMFVPQMNAARCTESDGVNATILEYRQCNEARRHDVYRDDDLICES